MRVQLLVHAPRLVALRSWLFVFFIFDTGNDSDFGGHRPPAWVDSAGLGGIVDVYTISIVRM